MNAMSCVEGVQIQLEGAEDSPANWNAQAHNAVAEYPPHQPSKPSDPPDWVEIPVDKDFTQLDGHSKLVVVKECHVEDIASNTASTVCEDKRIIHTACTDPDKNKWRRHAKKVITCTMSFIIIVSAVVPFFYIAIESAKEIRAKDGSMMDRQGNLVATAEYVSYATVFDLPAFSIKTLSAVKRINLQLSATTEAVLTVTSVVKHKGCNAVTLYTPDGADITVDGKTATVLARIRGKTYVLTSPHRRARLLKEALTPRLYSETEFFYAQNSLSSTSKHNLSEQVRRLASETYSSGWAALGVSVAAAVLDDCSTGSWLNHESVSLSGTVLVGEENIGMHAYYNMSEMRQSAVRVTYKDGASILIDYAVGIEFNFNPSGELTACETMTDVSAPIQELQSVVANAVEGGALLISGEDNDGISFLVQVDDFVLDTRSKPLQRPSIEDCLAVSESQDLEVSRNLSSNARQLSGHCGEMLTLSYAATAGDSSTPASLGWTEVKECQGINALAYVWARQGQLAVGFAGSNDARDWYFNNLWIPERQGYHGGFYDYVTQVKPCIDDAVKNHGGKVNYIVGHSLGGAAASVFYDEADNVAHDCKVITYGAPKTHSAGGCTIPGTRYAHQSDPVASNFWGIMGHYHHKTLDAKIYQDAEAHRRRRRWSWRRRRNWRWDTDLQGGCAQSSDSGLFYDTAYHFAITHTSYSSLGDQSC